MSESRLHSIEIRNREGAEGKMTVGANTEVLMDGKPLKGCRSIRIKISAADVARVQLEMFCNLKAKVATDQVTTQMLDPRLPEDKWGKPLQVSEKSVRLIKAITGIKDDVPAVEEFILKCAEEMVDPQKLVDIMEGKDA